MGVHTHVFKFMKDVCFKGFMKKEWYLNAWMQHQSLISWS